MAGEAGKADTSDVAPALGVNAGASLPDLSNPNIPREMLVHLAQQQQQQMSQQQQLHQTQQALQQSQFTNGLLMMHQQYQQATGQVITPGVFLQQPFGTQQQQQLLLGGALQPQQQQQLLGGALALPLQQQQQQQQLQQPVIHLLTTSRQSHASPVHTPQAHQQQGTSSSRLSMQVPHFVQHPPVRKRVFCRLAAFCNRRSALSRRANFRWR